MGGRGRGRTAGDGGPRAWAAGPAATGGPAAIARSRRSMRWRRAAGETSDSGWHRRTSDTSRSTRGSGASRMATRASPSTSMALTAAARPSRAIWASTRARSSSGRPTRLRETVARKAWRRRSSNSTARWRGSWPAPTRSATAASARPTSCSQRASISSSVEGPVSSMPPAAATWSSLERASRAEPAPRLATSSMTSSGTSRPASWATHRRWSARTSVDRRRNSKCWVRLRMVGSTFWGSVVARTKITWPGGSSRVLSRVFEASVVSMWTSSTMYTFHRPGVPRLDRETRSRMASTPRLEAASSSTTSRDRPSAISVHDAQTPQGSPSRVLTQFRALAKMRAVEVLPVPRGPLNR